MFQWEEHLLSKKKTQNTNGDLKYFPKMKRTVLLNSPNVPQWMMATQQPLKHWLQGKALGCPSGPGKQQRHTLTHSASLPVLHRALPNQPLISLSKFGSRGTWMCWNLQYAAVVSSDNGYLNQSRAKHFSSCLQLYFDVLDHPFHSVSSPTIQVFKYQLKMEITNLLWNTKT